MHTFVRIATFARFAFAEHIRSGRILIELAGTVAFWTVFFRDRGLAPLTLDVFFSLASIFALLLTLYTSSTLLSVGERPQGYLLLTRPLGRHGYLLGLYLVACFVALLMFAALTTLTWLFNRPLDFSMLELAKGSLPLVLNIALAAALMTLMSALVLPNVLRLGILAILAITLYSQTWHLSPVFRYIQPIQSILSWLIYPPLRAFRLASTRDFGATDVYVFAGQIVLTSILLGLALFSFSRRDVILRER